MLARLHQQSMLIFPTIALDHPKLALEPVAGILAFFRNSSSLAYWNLRWTVLKPYILPQHHN